MRRQKSAQSTPEHEACAHIFGPVTMTNPEDPAVEARKVGRYTLPTADTTRIDPESDGETKVDPITEVLSMPFIVIGSAEKMECIAPSPGTRRDEREHVSHA